MAQGTSLREGTEEFKTHRMKRSVGGTLSSRCSMTSALMDFLQLQLPTHGLHRLEPTRSAFQ